MQGWGWGSRPPNLGQGKLARGLLEERSLNRKQGSLPPHPLSLGDSPLPFSFSLPEPLLPGFPPLDLPSPFLLTLCSSAQLHIPDTPYLSPSLHFLMSPCLHPPPSSPHRSPPLLAVPLPLSSRSPLPPQSYESAINTPAKDLEGIQAPSTPHPKLPPLPLGSGMSFQPLASPRIGVERPGVVCVCGRVRGGRWDASCSTT